MYSVSERYDPVISVDEIAFAMTMFVEAANLNIPKDRAQLRPAPMQEFGRLFQALTADMTNAIAATATVVPTDCTIEFPFQMLWQHYEGDLRRASICARVLGFHSLMLQSQGALVERWLRPCPESPEAVMLDPMVVEAVARTPLDCTGVMAASSFLLTLEALANSQSACA